MELEMARGGRSPQTAVESLAQETKGERVCVLHSVQHEDSVPVQWEERHSSALQLGQACKPRKMTHRDFSTTQKLALAAIVMGSIMSFIGAVSPNWVVINGTGVGALFSVAKLDIGLWVYCGETLGEAECETIQFKDTTFHLVRIAACLCVLLGNVSSIAGVSIACCCQGNQTIGVGITSFLGGACGATALGIFISQVEGAVSLTYENIHVAHCGWGLVLFGAGFSVLLLASFVACVASPNNPLPEHILRTNPTVLVSQTTNNPYMPMTNSVESSSAMATYSLGGTYSPGTKW